jgi:hypothetical protein
MSRISCDECSRADVLRAVAGRGLPAIEAGMPVPAGTGLSRRSFVARSLGLALTITVKDVATKFATKARLPLRVNV